MVYLFTIAFVIYEQLLFKILTFGFSLDISVIYHILFSVLPGAIIVTICNLFKEKINKILMYILVFLTSLVTAAEYIYYCIYNSPFSTYSLTQGGMGQALDFIPTILATMWSNLYFLLFFLPVIVLYILFKKEKLELNICKKDLVIYCCVGALVYCSTFICINIDNNSVDSSYEIYYSSDNLLLRSNKFGLYTGMILDLDDTLFGSDSKNLSLFDSNGAIQKEEKNVTTTQKISHYLSENEKENKNDYTGLFKGKNLILIMAESFSPYVIDESLTPTLYKLKEEGFNFSNFYSPLFPVSTSDGEYMALTGLIPVSNTWSLTTSKDKHMNYSLASLFKASNYSTLAYHNNSKNYYSRYLALPSLGFDKFTACPDLNINCNVWPESDLEMIDVTTKDYTANNKFFTYYESVSGHLPYLSSNAMVKKNQKLTKNLKYTETIKNYIACQIELDKALENLITTLKSENKLENTVVAIYSDHYPYGLTIEELSSLAGLNIQNTFERSRGSFIIWNSSTKGKNITALSSTLDILPTLANLFDLKLDSSKIIGNDIFSDSEKIVIFSDQSFITDKVIYSNLKNSYLPVNNSNIKASDVEKLKIEVSNNFKVSTAILKTDYYNKINVK